MNQLIIPTKVQVCHGMLQAWYVSISAEATQKEIVPTALPIPQNNITLTGAGWYVDCFRPLDE